MNLPNYFLADLPPEATLSPSMLSEACQALKNNRERYLAGRTTESLLRLLASVARGWLEADDPFRKLVLEQGPAATGFSRETLACGLNTFFSQITAEALTSLLEQDLGHHQRLDVMTVAPAEQKTNRAALATGPDLLVHLAAGNIPNPALMSIVLGVLARSAQFVKCASGTSFLPRMFAHSIYQADPKLGACLELAEWKGGREDLEQVVFEEADCVTVTGSDETLEAIRRRLPPNTRFLGYGQRVSFAFVSSEVLAGLNGLKVAARAAADVVVWDQLGCLSPHVIYVEAGGGLTPEQFAELLAKELEQRQLAEPRGEVPVEVSAAISNRRSIYELRAGQSDQTRIWVSHGSTAWTVVYETEPQFQFSCLQRFIYVKAVSGLQQMLEAADRVRGKVSTIGIAVPEHRAQEVATMLARWGASRVCPLGRMQHPPVAWRHDGRPALGDLLLWTDWEMS